MANSCTDPCSGQIASALHDVATVLQSLDSHFAGLFAPAMQAQAQCVGSCRGCCQCSLDDCAAIVDQVSAKVLSNVYATMGQAQQYAAQLGAVPQSPVVASPQLPGSGAQLLPNAPPPSGVALQPNAPTVPAPVALQPVAPAPAPVAMPTGAWAQAFASAWAQAQASANASAQAGAIAAAVAGAVAQATAMTSVSQVSQNQLLAQVQGGSIVISPQGAPLTLQVQVLTDVVIQQLIQALTQVLLQVEIVQPDQAPQYDDSGNPIPAAQKPQRTVPWKQPGWSTPAGDYMVEVPEDIVGT